MIRTSKIIPDVDPELANDDAMLSHAAVLRAYLRRRIRRSEDVDDYVQEVYVRVLSAAPSKKIENWRGFLLRVASNLLKDHGRRDQVRMRTSHVALDDTPGLVDGYPSAERTLAARQRLKAVAEALDGIDPIARSVFLLVRQEGLTHREAGKRLGMETKRASRLVASVLVHLARVLVEGPDT